MTSSMQVINTTEKIKNNRHCEARAIRCRSQRFTDSDTLP